MECALRQGVEQSVAIIKIALRQCIVNDSLGHDAALTALAGCTQLLANLAQAGCAIVDGITYLAVGNSFADADVHELSVTCLGWCL